MSATVLPPVFGPVISSARVSPPASMVTGHDLAFEQRVPRLHQPQRRGRLDEPGRVAPRLGQVGRAELLGEPRLRQREVEPREALNGVDELVLGLAGGLGERCA